MAFDVPFSPAPEADAAPAYGRTERRGQLSAEKASPAGLVDSFGRRISYLRLSVTDRCDLRCVYCMAARPEFMPKASLLTLEELDATATAFIGLGVRKLRLTGGEPLVRRGFVELMTGLGRHVRSGALDELTLTTNASQLAPHAAALADAGVRRVNVSLDTVDPDRFARLTRGGKLAATLEGIEAAQAAGLKVKLNAVALKNGNADELPQLIAWAHGRGMEITLIETMPLSDVGEDRTAQFLPLNAVRRELESFWTLTDLEDSTGGPARYVRVAETGGRLGFITPMTGNFCSGCNRVRVTASGVLHACLGREDAVDLRAALRSGGGDAESAVRAAVLGAVAAKPERHDFRIGAGLAPALRRTMAATGG